jgi:hypothetical protein
MAAQQTHFNLAVNPREQFGQLVRALLQIEVLTLNGLRNELHGHRYVSLDKLLLGVRKEVWITSATEAAWCTLEHASEWGGWRGAMHVAERVAERRAARPPPEDHHCI